MDRQVANQAVELTALRESIDKVSDIERQIVPLMMRMLEAAGTPPLTDHVRAKDNDNQNGYYEFERVKALPRGDTEWLPQARGKAVKVISVLLEFLPSDHKYHVIFMRRHLQEILASQRKMLENRGETVDPLEDQRMVKLFTQHLHEVETWIACQTNIRCLFVDYNRVLMDPASEVRRLVGWFGDGCVAERMFSVVDPSLYRQKLRS
jgi:hypothetical protein